MGAPFPLCVDRIWWHGSMVPPVLFFVSFCFSFFSTCHWIVAITIILQTLNFNGNLVLPVMLSSTFFSDPSTRETLLKAGLLQAWTRERSVSGLGWPGRATFQHPCTVYIFLLFRCLQRWWVHHIPGCTSFIGDLGLWHPLSPSNSSVQELGVQTAPCSSDAEKA